MARTKEFDPDAALDAALELFWRRGYEATSMADLVEHLGIARASVYGTFGSKRELYLKALDRYQESTAEGTLAALSEPGPALPAVRRLVEAFGAQTLQDAERRGCFVTNTAVELAGSDAEAARRVERSWDGLESAIAGALTRARAQGELAAGQNPTALARFLVVLLQGLRVMGRARPEPERVRDAVRAALAVLDG
ncbi:MULTISPECIES: TetR/AcrR family transcriptional regulator [Streptomycetaceae]|uniref:TetR family transcriptional regulator n=1 Tax=Streptantibioticus cattleyicolor (strain ATCC 35852 / DSM 46488 / JCM 4925 / NBRC 14057 / NRRL 8057) TaxID=1003195 RepID=F8JU85_STREN|nr:MULTISPECIES: TetR/AcrR family transcriptional regulator [Streptomycetaceae]AEW93100.1 TetR family transcriptional regulator [Streptantibioticus cattleyicolor NRRL 8057 = DSM 46488]MYS57830.1 TetR family transcriptional regulator [Streptomyces sp. SID5468]CCB73459.1 putative tetR-family transcriptional regulator [Streptantibioticus cattleyicolor NRRL 8057 = DSM 46488]